MMKEADTHADEDRARKEEVETHNLADQAAYAAEKLIADSGDKLSAEAKQSIEAAAAALKTANEGTDVAAINTAIEGLTTAQHKAAEELYGQAGASGAGPSSTSGSDAGDASAGTGGSEEGDVIDAEVVEDDK